MNTKDYKAIGEIIKHWSENRDMMATQLADYFERDVNEAYTYPQAKAIGFNREQFLKDCGVK